MGKLGIVVIWKVRAGMLLGWFQVAEKMEEARFGEEGNFGTVTCCKILILPEDEGEERSSNKKKKD